MKQLRQTGLFILPHDLLVLSKVSPSWQCSPLYVIYLTHQNVLDCKVQLVKFNPAKLPFPSAVQRHWYARTHKCTHACACLPAHKRTFLVSIPLTPSKYKQLSCRCLYELNVLCLIFRSAVLLNVLPLAYHGLFWVGLLLCFQQPAANEHQADSSETKQSTIINEDSFHLT